MHHLIGRGWVTFRDRDAPTKGRPEKIYALTMPFASVIRAIEQEKTDELNRKLLALAKAERIVEKRKIIHPPAGLPQRSSARWPGRSSPQAPSGERGEGAPEHIF